MKNKSNPLVLLIIAGGLFGLGYYLGGNNMKIKMLEKGGSANQLTASPAEDPLLKGYSQILQDAYKQGAFNPKPNSKVAIKKDTPVLGNKNAKVTIIEFNDPSCPYCVRAFSTVKQLEKDYKDKIKLAFYYFPGHGTGEDAMQAMLCAGDQGKFWEMNDKVFSANEQAYGFSGPTKAPDAQLENVLTSEFLNQYAGEIGLDMEKFGNCLTSKKYADWIKKSTDYGREMGVGGTPSFYINGILLGGAFPLENFKEIIDKELGRIR